ncbi:hypothetical protein BVRB_8g181430 [Beta vulgaris subsp. vulgaris]|nr:hypothetical protein BVRB_8g181430 [Beta vulgaris subsp. vulgaris]
MVDAGKESFLLNWLMDDVKELSTVHVASELVQTPDWEFGLVVNYDRPVKQQATELRGWSVWVGHLQTY